MFYQFKTAVSINKFILYTLILKKQCKAFGCFYIAGVSHFAHHATLRFYCP